jgi:hypothetical protein
MHGGAEAIVTVPAQWRCIGWLRFYVAGENTYNGERRNVTPSGFWDNPGLFSI